jgi:branched-chain amino acid transport system substrate-binding protein
MKKRWQRMTMAAVLGSSLATVTAGGVMAGTAGASLPSTINLYSIQDASGAAGAVGVDNEDGINLAIKEINASHLLGSSKLAITYGDDATNPTSAANLATQAASAHYPLVIGPPASSTAVAVAPILARVDEPTIFTQAGGPGTLLNKYIFRLTPLQTDRIPEAFAWLKSKDVKTLGIIDDSDFPTQAALAQEAQADTEGVSVTQSNISAEISNLVSHHPEGISLDLTLTQNATAATELAQAGFKGPIIAEDGAGNGTLSGAGADANGIVWASDWVPGTPNGTVSTDFTKAYEAAYHTSPSDWAAEAFDATYFAARALKEAGSTSPAAVDEALIKEGKAGYTGVLGKATVTDGQEHSKAVLVQWENGAAVPLTNQNP